MTRRAAVGTAFASVFALAAIAAVILALDGGSSPSPPAKRYRGSEPPARFTLPDFSLRDYDGRVVASDEVRGRVTVLTLLDSQCTESCPVIVWTVARAIDSLTRAERDEVAVIALSTDPAEDTRSAVRRFLARNRALGRLSYVGGGQPERVLRRIWSELDVLSSLESGRDSLHSAPVRIYDRQGVWVATLHAGADLDEQSLVHDIRVALG